MIPNDSIVLGSQEKNDGIALLLLPFRDGHHAMHARMKPLTGEEAEHVANIHNRMPWPWLHVMPTFFQQYLEAPLLAEEKRETAGIGMFMQAESFRVGILSRVAQ